MRRSAPRRRPPHQRRRDAARPVRAAHRRSGRPRAARHRPLPRPGHAGPGRRPDRVPAARLRQRRQALRAGVEPAPHRPLQRRVARGRAAARARQRPVGEGEEARGAAGARHRGRAAQPVRAARGAQGPRVRASTRTTTRRFADGFGFEETPDQQARDRGGDRRPASPGKPMDRLVCGDVGFGKTEVALRAAFVALADGKQVAVLVPTTLLAEQHFQMFSDRFADWPVQIAELSRFRSPKEVKAALDGLAAGSIDLVIGTHKLIQPDVKFKNLGLVIIDEEHRFGVRQKEQLKTPARRGRRADADRDADPAHAGDVARGHPRLLGDRDRAAAAAVDQDLRRAVLAGHRPRGGAARAEARRADLLPAQRHRHHRAHRAETLAKLVPEARIAHRARPDGRARPRARDARLLPAARSTCCCARRSSRPASTCRPPTPSSSTAPTASASRSCTSCAAASAARTTRPTRTC